MAETIAIIPARAGSKGIPGKNYRIIDGKPLVYWSLLAAYQSQVTTMVLTTNCQIVKTIGQEFQNTFGCYDRFRIIDRPEHLCTDSSGTDEVMLHAIYDTTYAPVFSYDYAVLLQPTSPIRTKTLINECISIVEKHNHSSLLTVEPHTPFFFKMLAGNKSKSMWNVATRKSRQQFSSTDMLYHDDGCLYITKMSHLVSSRCRLTDSPYLFINDAYSSFQLDSEVDFSIASKLMKEIRVSGVYI